VGISITRPAAFDDSVERVTVYRSNVARPGVFVEPWWR
jgi:hypothetical protein